MTKHQAQPYEQAECARWFHHKKIAFPDLVYASGYVLLHARRERPRERRTADARYELAPPHGLLLRARTTPSMLRYTASSSKHRTVRHKGAGLTPAADRAKPSRLLDRASRILR